MKNNSPLKKVFKIINIFFYKLMSFKYLYILSNFFSNNQMNKQWSQYTDILILI